jgi:agmatine deiminase
MPIQTDSNTFVQFRYEAPYLNQEPELRTIPAEVLQANGFKPSFADIILDGGNIVRSTDKVIITKRVFKDNPTISKNDLINALEQHLHAKVLIIPDHTTDETGHADGHIRFINDKTVLVNELANEFKYWQQGFRKMIQQYGLDYIEMPWFEPKLKNEPISALGIYVNYLEIDNLIIFPIFQIPGNKDQQALNTITNAFPNKIIEPININEIGLKGGLMNCISWNIRN